MSEQNEDIFLYWGSGSPPCWRILVALEEKELKYDHKLMEFSKNDHKSEEIMNFNSRGQLPTLKIGNKPIITTKKRLINSWSRAKLRNLRKNCGNCGKTEN